LSGSLNKNPESNYKRINKNPADLGKRGSKQGSKVIKKVTKKRNPEAPSKKGQLKEVSK